MITRRRFLGTLAGGLLAAPLVAEAQQAGKVWRIGLLDSASDPASVDRWKTFRERLGGLGYAEGKNVVFESRWASGQLNNVTGVFSAEQ